MRMIVDCACEQVMELFRWHFCKVGVHVCRTATSATCPGRTWPRPQCMVRPRKICFGGRIDWYKQVEATSSYNHCQWEHCQHFAFCLLNVQTLASRWIDSWICQKCDCAEHVCGLRHQRQPKTTNGGRQRCGRRCGYIYLSRLPTAVQDDKAWELNGMHYLKKMTHFVEKCGSQGVKPDY